MKADSKCGRKSQQPQKVQKPKDPMEQQQTCVTDKEHQNKLINLFLMHLHFHPLIQFHDSPELSTVEDMKYSWGLQVMEMHALCEKLNESWAWEYFWKHWYRSDRWTLWARAACNAIPISNSNAFVEALWSCFKRRYLRRYSRPRIEYMIEILMNQYFPNHVDLVRAFRDLREDPTW